MSIDIIKLKKVYEKAKDNWGDLINFQGEYINFGLWDEYSSNLKNKITIEQRVHSSLRLYMKILERLNLDGDIVLELGCGRGMGIVQVLPIERCQKIIAIDINEDQLNRAKINVYSSFYNKKSIYEKISFMNANAENINLPDNSIDAIYSVEASQHFNSIYQFAKEMFRLLKENGKIVFASYFPTEKKIC